MKALIAALALLTLAVGPAFASPHGWQRHEGHTGIYFLYSGGTTCWRYFGGPKGGLWPGECP
jgi:hypothetical protein